MSSYSNLCLVSISQKMDLRIFEHTSNSIHIKTACSTQQFYSCKSEASFFT